MALVCRGTSSLKDDRSWRIPFGLFFVIPTIVAVGVWFIPEVGQYSLERKLRANASDPSLLVGF